MDELIDDITKIIHMEEVTKSITKPKVSNVSVMDDVKLK